jgi:hypothetical protein
MSHSTVSRPKRKTFPIQPRIVVLDRLLQSCLAILLVNWIFQGMRGMQSKELSFRLVLELACVVAVGTMAWSLGVGTAASLLIGLLVGHTINFLFNGQFWVCARYCQSYQGTAQSVARATIDLAAELSALPWLLEVAFIGSRARSGLPSDRSDIDLRLVFPPGTTGWWKTNLLLMRLRTRALLRSVPLDLYAYDRPDALKRFNQEEPLLVVKDADARLRQMFPMRCKSFGSAA